MLTQVATFHIGRIWLIALAAFALAAFVAFAAMPRLQFNTASAPSVAVTPVQIQRAVEPATCGNGAYITGDLAGDASPASVYSALCPSR